MFAELFYIVILTLSKPKGKDVLSAGPQF